MFKFHYLTKVPECPFCHSNKTGRYIDRDVNPKNIQGIETEYLNRGEYIRIRRPGDEEYTAFCFECGNSWYAPLQGEWVTKAEKRAYIKEKIDPQDVEDANELEMQMNKAHKKKGPRIFRRAGSIALKGTKKMLKLMVYDPTVGTVKDLLKVNTVSDHNQKEEPTFHSLYDEILQEELEQELDADIDSEEDEDLEYNEPGTGEIFDENFDDEDMEFDDFDDEEYEEYEESDDSNESGEDIIEFKNPFEEDELP